MDFCSCRDGGRFRSQHCCDIVLFSLGVNSRFSSNLDGLIIIVGFGSEGLQNLMCLEIMLTLKFKKKSSDYSRLPGIKPPSRKVSL